VSKKRVSSALLRFKVNSKKPSQLKIIKNNMEELIKLAQLAVAISVFYVWIFRFHNVRKEFKQFELSDLNRSFIGVTKTSIATLLVVGIWYSSLVLIPSILMGLLMVGAQYFHFKASNPFIQRLPSLILLLLCAFIALASTQ
jgi:hypothetical protein